MNFAASFTLLMTTTAAAASPSVEAADPQLRGGPQLKGAQQLGPPQEGVRAPALSEAVPPAILEELVIEFLGDGAMSGDVEGLDDACDLCEGVTGCAIPSLGKCYAADDKLFSEKGCGVFGENRVSAHLVKWCKATVSSRIERKLT